VIIAAYNESAVLGRVLSDVLHCGYRVLVIDDGSRDATRDVALRSGAVVVGHPVNLG